VAACYSGGRAKQWPCKGVERLDDVTGLGHLDDVIGVGQDGQRLDKSEGALEGSGAYPLALVPSRVGPRLAVVDHGPLFCLSE
jgi:hypothetical protein